MKSKPPLIGFATAPPTPLATPFPKPKTPAFFAPFTGCSYKPDTTDATPVRAPLRPCATP